MRQLQMNLKYNMELYQIVQIKFRISLRTSLCINVTQHLKVNKHLNSNCAVMVVRCKTDPKSSDHTRKNERSAIKIHETLITHRIPIHACYAFLVSLYASTRLR